MQRQNISTSPRGTRQPPQFPSPSCPPSRPPRRNEPSQLLRFTPCSAINAIPRNRKNCNVYRSRSFMPWIVLLSSVAVADSQLLCVPLKHSAATLPSFSLLRRARAVHRDYRITGFQLCSPALCKQPLAWLASLPPKQRNIDEARLPAAPVARYRASGGPFTPTRSQFRGIIL